MLGVAIGIERSKIKELLPPTGNPITIFVREAGDYEPQCQQQFKSK